MSKAISELVEAIEGLQRALGSAHPDARYCSRCGSHDTLRIRDAEQALCYAVRRNMVALLKELDWKEVGR